MAVNIVDVLKERLVLNGLNHVHTKSSTALDGAVEEVVLNVSSDVASMALGFSIDAGGSVTKLVYRSKDDYENGVPKDKTSSGGKLRLRYLKNNNGGEALIQFLHLNCDIRDLSLLSNGSTDTTDTKDSAFWYNTGVGYQHYKKTLEDDLRIQTKTLSEMDGGHRALSGFYSKNTSGSSFQAPLPLTSTAMEKSLFLVRQLMTMMQTFKAMGDKAIGEMYPVQEDMSKIEAHAMKLMTTDAEKLAAELSVTEIEYPCQFVVIGSAFTLGVIASEGKPQALGDFSGLSGKTFLGLGMVLTGAKNFLELIEMAARGDSRKVNTLAGDMKNRDRDEVDWYSLMMDDFVIFSLGKISEKHYEGSYSKDDLAAGLVKLFSDSMCKLSIAHARLNKVKSVIYTGSYLCHHVVRESIQESFYSNTLLLPFGGVDQIKMAILPNPGFLCALGTWQANLDLENERKKQTNAEKS